MLVRTVILIILFSYKLSIGQFTDSLILKTYDQETYNFHFFKKNKIKAVEHYKYYYTNDTVSYKYLEYKISYDMKRNLIIKTNSANSKEYYIEGHFGHPVWCVEFGKNPVCEDNVTFDKQGNIIKSNSYKINYDSLNRIVLMYDTLNYNPNCSWNKKYHYENNKLKNITDTRYDKCVISDVIVYDYSYKSDREFNCVITFPPKWLKPQWRYEYVISKNGQRLETYFYNNNILETKEVDQIIK